VRLLYLHYGPQSGVTASMARALAAEGVEVQLVNPTERVLWRLAPGSRLPNPRPAALRAFVEALRRHGRAWKEYWLHTPWAFDHVSRLAGDAIRRHRPDAVLQSGVLFGPGLAPEVPYHLYVDHTRAIAERYPEHPLLPSPLPPDPEWRARETRVYLGARAIFSMSAFAARSLTDDYGVDPARVHVVGAGPNVAPEGGAGARPDGGGAAGPPREPAILFVGRLFELKGGPDLLEAFGRLRASRPRARLWIVGQSAPSPLPPGAIFHGPLDGPALAGLYARASVFALPSLREAFGLAFVEAMTFGLPVVGTRVEAIPEIVADGETGLLVPPGDPPALAGALAALLDDPGRAAQMGAAGRERAAVRFGWDRTAGRVLAVLDEDRASGLRPRASANPHGFWPGA
jgi:glycosyltransferase involved in cell wall biosynthesis